jgi:hypothetical protein
MKFIKLSFVLLIGFLPIAAYGQNVETRVQTRIETQVETIVRPGSAQTGVDISFDEVAFNAVGNARSEKEAIVEAYSTGIGRILRQLAGAQAEAEIGQRFRDDMERDFNVFRRRYFSSDTAHNCRALDRSSKPIAANDKKTPVAQYSCRADGTIKMLALKNDFQRMMKSTERTLSNALTFVVSTSETNDANASYVADKLTSAFLGSGFKVLTGSAATKAIDQMLAAKDDPRTDKRDLPIDFSLAVSGLEFTRFSYDQSEQRLSGALTVRFKLLDMKGDTQVAAVPVNISQSVRGPNSEALRSELRERLSNAASIEVGRQTSAAVVNFQVARGADAAAEERAKSEQKQYVVRIVGLSSRDRRQLADVRNAIKSSVPDAIPEVNTSESSDSRVTLNFATGVARLDTEDVLDKLFDAFKSNKSFDAQYKGNNEFSVTF